MSERVLNLHDFIMLSMALECLLMVVFFCMLSKATKDTKWYLGAFLLSLGISCVGVVLLWNPAITLPGPFQKILPLFLFSSLYLRGVFLYMYALSVLRIGWRKSAPWPHVIPLVLIVLLSAYLGFSADDLRHYSGEAEKALAVRYVWHCIKFAPLGYAGLVVWRVYTYFNQLKNNVADCLDDERLLLFVLAVGFLLTWLWEGSVHVLGGYGFLAPEFANTLALIDNYMAFVLLNVFFVCSVKFADRLPEIHMESNQRERESDVLQGSGTYIGAKDFSAVTSNIQVGITGIDATHLVTMSHVERVRSVVEDEKIYLESGVSIKRLAEASGLKVSEVSTVLSKYYGKTFFEYINAYRVEEAKRLLASLKHRDQTILDILIQSGFNSTSTFHRQFTRVVGVSPSEYRKNMTHN